MPGLPICLLWVGIARAQPTVRVRAASHLQLQLLSDGSARALRGSLLDDTDAPLARRRIDVVWFAEGASVPSARQAARTSDDGNFALGLPASLERGRVRASFGGDGAYATSEGELAFDPKKLEVQLRFLQPRDARVDLDAKQTEIAIFAHSERGAVRLPIEILDEQGRALGSGRVAEDGAFRLRLPARSLGAPGTGRLIARSEGDDERSAARAELSIVRFARTQLTLEARFDTQPGRLVLSGTLLALERGLPQQAIELTSDSTAIATVLTDDSGRFAYRAAHASLPGQNAKRLRVRARFVSASPWLGSSASRSVEVALSAAARHSTFWLLLPLLACALILARLSRRAAERDAIRDGKLPLPRAGIQVGPAGPRTVPTRSDVAGHVFDAASGRKIGEARVLLTRNGEHVELRVDPDAARFAYGELAAGRWQLQVSAPAYRGIEGEFVVPHAGQWSNIQVGLQSLRSEALLAYKPAAVRVLASPELWEVSTPRETLASARRSGRATESFVQLTERVEHAAYAAPAPTEADVISIEDDARAVVDSDS